jgi:hypothetical protein
VSQRYLREPLVLQDIASCEYEAEFNHFMKLSKGKEHLSGIAEGEARRHGLLN